MTETKVLATNYFRGTCLLLSGEPSKNGVDDPTEKSLFISYSFTPACVDADVMDYETHRYIVTGPDLSDFDAFVAVMQEAQKLTEHTTQEPQTQEEKLRQIDKATHEAEVWFSHADYAFGWDGSLDHPNAEPTVCEYCGLDPFEAEMFYFPETPHTVATVKFQSKIGCYGWVDYTAEWSVESREQMLQFTQDVADVAHKSVRKEILRFQDQLKALAV